MDNKKVLSKLVKIASNQQAILNKLAQSYAVDAGADNAMNDFVKYQFTSWAMPREVAARLSHTIEKDTNSKHYDVNIDLTLSDPSQKSLAEDPVNGFASWLTKKLATAPSVEKWKDLEGCTATFTVTTK
jgi:hypothetical protein